VVEEGHAIPPRLANSHEREFATEPRVKPMRHTDGSLRNQRIKRNDGAVEGRGRALAPVHALEFELGRGFGNCLDFQDRLDAWTEKAYQPIHGTIRAVLAERWPRSSSGCGRSRPGCRKRIGARCRQE
jgi:hypothetical protein